MGSIESVTATEPDASTGVILCAGDEFAVCLRASSPAIASVSSATGARLDGALPDERVLFRVQRIGDKAAYWTDDAQWSVEYRAGRGESAVYHATVLDGQIRAAECDLRFQLRNGELTIELAGVLEERGYQLLSVRLPAIVSVRSSRGDGRMLLPWCGGRLIDPAECKARQSEHPLTWWDAIPAGAVYHSDLLALVQVDSCDDVLRSEVKELDEGDRAAGLSAEFVHRQAADRADLQFVTHASSRVRVKYIARVERPMSWMDAVSLLRGQLHAVTSPAIYDRTLIYKVMCDYPATEDYVACTSHEPEEAEHVKGLVEFLDQPRRTRTFDHVLELVRGIHHLTGGLRQIVYLVGWQHKGHDTGYPDVFTINDRLGGMAALRRLMSEAGRYNAVISFHDNYDDAYRLSPAWDEAIVARGPDGELCKGGVWAGGRSYIISSAWYAGNGMRDRVRRTVELLGVKESYHIDVLSAAVRRMDFSSEHPAGVDANIAGKLAVIEELRRLGLDVTSEGLVWPFVGQIGHAWILRYDPTVAYEGEVQVPFASFLFHGHATHGGPVTDDPSMISAILYGHTFNNDVLPDTPVEQVLERIYLVNAPYLLLRDREILSYTQLGGVIRVGYGPDSKTTYVEAEPAAGRYRVVVDGREVARDYSCFVPGPRPQEWLAYSRHETDLAYLAPKTWRDGDKVVAEALCKDASIRPVSCTVREGHVRVKVAAGVPVRIRRPAM